MDEVLTQALIEVFRKRAAEKGDDFHLEGVKVQVRCLQPDKHQNGDAHPSAFYYFGRYLYCLVCGLKMGQKKLAEHFGLSGITSGLTLAALAAAKNLPVDFLQVYGWRTQAGRSNQAQVLIPWFDEKGVSRHPSAYHIRHYINKNEGVGPRFTWDLPPGKKLNPYGIWLFKEYCENAKRQQIPSYIVITESEIDTLTGWLHQIPACATGGADGWRSDWADLFMNFDKIVIAQEPGSPGLEMVKRIGQSFIKDPRKSTGKVPDVLACPFPENMKDLNALHLSVGDNTAGFQRVFQDLVSKAVPVKVIIDSAINQEEAELQHQKAEEKNRLMSIAGPLLKDPGVLHRAIKTVESLGVVGERRNIGLLHLTFRSRSLSRPVNIEVSSASSAGKTHLVVSTLSLEDTSAYYELTAGSERSLIYLDESLQNRIMFIQEPEGLAEGIGAAVIKSLTWEGRLRYDTVVQEGGNLVGKHIEKEGPTGLIICTTKPLEEQISNRLFRTEVDASEEQTKRVLNAIALAAAGQQLKPELTPWHAFSILSGSTAEVIIVFASFLADNISTSTLRIRRDFTHLLNLIKACTIEYRFQRTSTPGCQLLATVADYAMVYSLVAETFRAIQAEGIMPADRKMMAAVAELTTPPGGKPGERPIAQATLRTHLKLSKGSTSYRVNRLIKLGYLSNLASKPGTEKKLVPGAPLPDEPAPLPSPCKLAEYLVQNSHPELIIPWVDPVTGAFHDCRQHLDNKYFQNATSSSPEHIEPLPVLASNTRGSISVEPVEPPERLPLPDGSNGSRGSIEAEPPQSEAKLPGGSTQSGEEDNIENDNAKNEDWGEV